MERIKKLGIISVILIGISCNTKTEQQEVIDEDLTFIRNIEQDAVSKHSSADITFAEKDIFVVGECKSYNNEDSYTFSEICHYPNAQSIEDLYQIFKKNYKYTTKISPSLPNSDTIIKGEYPIEINYSKTKFKKDTVNINLIFPGGEDYIYLYIKNDSSFINNIHSPD